MEEREGGKKGEKGGKIDFNSRSKPLPIRFTHAELKQYHLTAKDLKITRAKYIRQLIKNGTVTVTTIDISLEKLHFELNKIGVNLNQIAKVLNETRDGNQPIIINKIEVILAIVSTIIIEIESIIELKRK